jgi:hypothetical protein
VGNLISYRHGNYNFIDESSTTWHDIISELRDKRKYIGAKKDLPQQNIKPNLKNVVEGKLYDKDDIENNKDGIKAGLKEIRSTEYNVNEVERIERAFENVSKDGTYDHNGKRGDAKDGLLRAITVLGKIHDIPNSTVKCMKDHVKKGTYKFSYKFEHNYGDTCPTVLPLRKKK